MDCGIIDELKRELSEATSSFEILLNERKGKCLDFVKITPSSKVTSLLEEIDAKSQGALQQCQQLQHLHNQIQSIKATQAALNSLNRAEVSKKDDEIVF